jgi:hypothetical protein
MEINYKQLIITGLVASLVAFFGGQITASLKLPAKMDLIEYRLDRIEGGVGTINSMTSSNNADLQSLIKILKEKDIIK